MVFEGQPRLCGRAHQMAVRYSFNLQYLSPSLSLSSSSIFYLFDFLWWKGHAFLNGNDQRLAVPRSRLFWNEWLVFLVDFSVFRDFSFFYFFQHIFLSSQQSLCKKTDHEKRWITFETNAVSRGSWVVCLPAGLTSEIRELRLSALHSAFERAKERN